MRIRTRFLLFLLPTFIGSIALVSSLLAYNWYSSLEHLKEYITADVDIRLIDAQFRQSLFLIFLSASFTILIVVGTLFMIANKISHPIQKLNHSALALAAGQYGESITSQGPREIAELAGTLNIMSECLLENINRLKENAILRERMYGKYECAMLLQHLMLQKNIDDCKSDAIAVKPITFFSENPRGILLHFPKANVGQFTIELSEALTEGFEGMYQLLTGPKTDGETTCITLDEETSTLHTPNRLLLWSMSKKRFLDFTQCIQVQTGDLFFLYNQGMLRFYKNHKNIQDLLNKVLNIFALDGLETTSRMLQKEISFLVKRKDPQEDVHLLCFQVLN
ncbi:MAG TPA: HAMP domain-containing protein [Chlamydiales bacterium]|nr:HAMP domain-containing protein [Chlamydiales bacterium]